ncbi:Crp/Fnr family transcriptional regulator [Tenacibaculum agarivorans]|uniref:Crp/Fnr family transcriptional regulator n=1 Tax=Tenacibaculum agarivorans TaxID=1908389 RepID=UPI00094B7C72|nr:Crp/Fnr family transcriptional regulator [Tenacibaculum agarivorans]
MESLLSFISSAMPLSKDDIQLLKKVFTPIHMPAKSVFIKEGKTEQHLYFLERGIVKGYKINDGKVVIEHLVEANNFLASLDSFFSQTAAKEYFETITDCDLFKISKADFDLLKQSGDQWIGFIESITNESMRCKLERVNDFQTLTAKERYLKFITKTPNLAANVSVENMASYLGMEPQSLSRIRRQITF